MTLLTIVVLCFGWRMNEARKQSRAVAAIEEAGGRVYYGNDDGAYASGALQRLENPPWYQRGILKHFLSRVTCVDLSYADADDATLRHLEALPYNQEL